MLSPVRDVMTAYSFAAILLYLCHNSKTLMCCNVLMAVCVCVFVYACLTAVSSLAQTLSMAALQTSLAYKSIMQVLLQQLGLRT